MKEGPGRHLLTHPAPAGLLGRARRLQGTAPEPRRFGWAVAAAVFVVGISAGWLLRGVTGAHVDDPQTQSLAAQQGTAMWVEGEASVPVRLVVHQPEASSVSVAGSWNDWDPAAAPLRRTRDGVFWTVVEIPRGRHEYMFVVDGHRWVADPTAPLTADDGFGRQNAVLEI